MDAYRLRSIIEQVIEEHERVGVDHGTARILQALDACIADPSGASDDKFRGALMSLAAALRGARTNDCVESERRIMVEIGADRFTGEGLSERMLAIANERPFLAGRAKELYVRLGRELREHLDAMTTLRANLQTLNIEPVKRGADEYELGILLPDTVVEGDLDRLIGELNDWDRVFKELLAVMTGEAGRVRLRCYTAGRFELAVPLGAEGALAVGKAIAGIYAMFTKVKANRERVAELELQKYPSELVDRFKEFEQQIIQRELTGIREEITAHCAKNRSAKPKELSKILAKGLKFLAVRIREGVHVEILGPTQTAAAEHVEGRASDDAVPHHVRAALKTAGRKPDPAKAGSKEPSPGQMVLSQITRESSEPPQKAA